MLENLNICAMIQSKGETIAQLMKYQKLCSKLIKEIIEQLIIHHYIA